MRPKLRPGSAAERVDVATRKSRIASRAQARAFTALARKYKAEYDELYRTAKASLMREAGLLP